MSDTAPSPPHSPIAASVAEATERRLHQQAPIRSTSEIAAEYEKRLHFRRLIEPGIMRPNAYETAMASLKVPSALFLDRIGKFMLVFLRPY
jgi:hypothetical protein